MSCSHCGSSRKMSIYGHSKDCNNWEIPHLKIEDDGYAPNIPGVCGGDDIDITFCLDCGMLYHFTPISDSKLKEILNIEEDDDDEYDNGRSYQQSLTKGNIETDNWYDQTVNSNSTSTIDDTYLTKSGPFKSLPPDPSTVKGPFDISDLQVLFNSAVKRGNNEFTFFYIGLDNNPLKRELLKHTGLIEELVPLLEDSEYVANGTAIPTFRKIS